MMPAIATFHPFSAMGVRNYRWSSIRDAFLEMNAPISQSQTIYYASLGGDLSLFYFGVCIAQFVIFP